MPIGILSSRFLAVLITNSTRKTKNRAEEMATNDLNNLFLE